MTSTVDCTFPPAIGVEEGTPGIEEVTVVKVDRPVEAIVEPEVDGVTAGELEILTGLVLETAVELEAGVLTELVADVGDDNTELDTVVEPELDLIGLLLETAVGCEVETLTELDALDNESTTELDPNMVLKDGLVTWEVCTVVKNDELETSDEVMGSMLHIVTENLEQTSAVI